MDRFLTRHGSIRRVTQFYLAVTPASLSCGGSMVSGRRSVRTAAGARYNIASENAGVTGNRSYQGPGNQ
ncbi:hypothetical protein Hanom_Chr16g01445521 [Helianthus anomalus]